MAISNVLSGFGSIIKKEFVRNLKIRGLKNYMILESADPFPEAHVRHKSSFVKFYFLPFEAESLDQDTKIAAHSAEGQIGGDLASALGDITIGEQTYHAIRLRNVSEKLLPLLIKAYENSGIRLLPAGDAVRDYASIRIEKFFHLEEIGDGLFTDLDDPQIGYLEIPRKLKWEDLESLCQAVKQETNHPNFDCAFGNISKHGEQTEVIRFYAPDMDEEVLREIGSCFRKIVTDKS